MGRGSTRDKNPAPAALRTRSPAPAPAAAAPVDLDALAADLERAVRTIGRQAYNVWSKSQGAKLTDYGADIVDSVQQQRPAATRIAGKRAWSTRGRTVRPGAVPIRIGAGKRIYQSPVHPKTGTVIDNPRVAKFFGLSPKLVGYQRTQDVYDIADTDPVDPPVRTPAERAAAQRMTADLTAAIEAMGARVYLGGATDPDDRVGARVNKTLLSSSRAAHGVHSRIEFPDLPGRKFDAISTPGGLDPVHEAMVLAHEYGHLKRGHLDVPEIIRGRYREEHEIEAEGFAYLLAARYGIDWPGSAWYMKGYAHGKEFLLGRGLKVAVDQARAFPTG